MSTRIHPKNVHKNSPQKRTSRGQNVHEKSPKVSMRSHLLCASMVAYLLALLYQLASPAHTHTLTHAQALGTLNLSFSRYFNPILIRGADYAYNINLSSPTFERWHYWTFSISSVQCVTECAIRPPRGPCAPHMTLSKDILSSCYRKGKAHLPFSAFGKKTATFRDSCFWAN